MDEFLASVVASWQNATVEARAGTILLVLGLVTGFIGGLFVGVGGDTYHFLCGLVIGFTGGVFTLALLIHWINQV